MNAPPRSTSPDVVSLREYLESRISDVERDVVRVRTEMSEIKGERNMYVPRGEYQIAKDAHDRSIRELELARSHQAGSVSRAQVYGAYVVAVLGWIITAAAFLMQ